MAITNIEEVQIFSVAQINPKKRNGSWVFGEITTATGTSFNEAVQTARRDCFSNLKNRKAVVFPDNVEQLGVIILSFQSGVNYEVMYQPCWSFEY